MAMTFAKIGRSMKKREIIRVLASFGRLPRLGV